MAVYIGNIIRKVMADKKVSVNFLAEHLGMHTGSVSRLYSYPSVQTEMLQKISVALDYDFFAVYSRELNIKKEEEVVMVVEAPAKIDYEKLLKEKIAELEALKKENAYLKEINGLLHLLKGK